MHCKVFISCFTTLKQQALRIYEYTDDVNILLALPDIQFNNLKEALSITEHNSLLGQECLQDSVRTMHVCNTTFPIVGKQEFVHAVQATAT